MIKLLIPDMPSTEALVPWLHQLDHKKCYTNFGPLSLQLEGKLAGEIGALKHEVTLVSSAPLGLELTLQSLNLKPGSLVLIPIFSFAATITAVLRSGYVPIFSDIDPLDWVLKPEIAKSVLEEFNISAVMPVATFGNPLPSSLWDSFVQETGIPVIIDAAGAFGNQEICQNCSIVFSLHATKSLSTGEGGFVVGPYEIVERVRFLSNFGISNAGKLAGYIENAGTNAKLSEYHSAVGLANYDLWKKKSFQRQALNHSYIRHISELFTGATTLQHRPIDGIYTIFSIKLNSNLDLVQIIESMRMSGVETRRWYYPLLHKHPISSNLRAANSLENASALSSHLLGLPFHLELDEQAIKAIMSALSLAINKQG